MFIMFGYLGKDQKYSFVTEFICDIILENVTL